MKELGQAVASILLVLALYALISPDGLGQASRSIVNGFYQAAD